MTEEQAEEEAGGRGGGGASACRHRRDITATTAADHVTGCRELGEASEKAGPAAAGAVTVTVCPGWAPALCAVGEDHEERPGVVDEHPMEPKGTSAREAGL